MNNIAYDFYCRAEKSQDLATVIIHTKRGYDVKPLKKSLLPFV